MNPTRTYFIRTRNRNRILATLVCRIVDGKLAFGISRSSREESSPSRRIGRTIATKRLERAVNTNQSVFTVSYFRDRKDTPDLLISGILDLSQVVGTLNRLLLDDQTIGASIPTWCWKQDEEAFGVAHKDQYLDMFCKIRNSVEKGTF